MITVETRGSTAPDKGRILQQEKQQIQHDAEADGEAKSPFANQKRAAGQILTAFQSGIRELLLDLLRAIKVMIGEEAFGPAGKMGEQAWATTVGDWVSLCCSLLYTRLSS